MPHRTNKFTKPRLEVLEMSFDFQ